VCTLEVFIQHTVSTLEGTTRIALKEKSFFTKLPQNAAPMSEPITCSLCHRRHRDEGQEQRPRKRTSVGVRVIGAVKKHPRVRGRFRDRVVVVVGDEFFSGVFFVFFVFVFGNFRVRDASSWCVVRVEELWCGGRGRRSWRGRGSGR